jgi:hypothetical protein
VADDVDGLADGQARVGLVVAHQLGGDAAQGGAARAPDESSLLRVGADL